MNHRNKLLILISINLAILVYSGYFYFQGYSLGRVLTLLIVSAIVLNVVAEFTWRAALKRKASLKR